VLLAACMLVLTAQGPAKVDIEAMLTVAESSDWRATSTHAEVLEFCRRLDEASPRVHMEEAGRTLEGRSLPILILADPPVTSPEQVGDRLVAFAWGGIHSGEVCGKPATLMLAREIAAHEHHRLLEKLVIVFLPLLNADGNERMGPDNRPGQVGPVEGMGVRANSQGFDINRDFTKLDTAEARAILGVLNRWDPAVAMDLHTTNGSRHQYVLTYDGQRHPAADSELRDWTRDVMLNDVSARVEADTGYKTFFYGNFSRSNTQWLTYPAQLRYSTHYLGLHHHVALLSEAYSYASYRDRVLATIAFMRHSFQYVADHAQDVRALRAGAKRRAAAGTAPVCLRQESKLGQEPVQVLGYSGGRGEPQGEPRTYELLYDGTAAATLSVTPPGAYLFDASSRNVLENLTAHGIVVEALTGETELEVEVYRLDSINRAERPYEQHRLVTVEVTLRKQSRTFPAGTAVVRTNQELGPLAACLLEPRSEDGLCTWNYFDDVIADQADFPVVRVPPGVSLNTRATEH